MSEQMKATLMKGQKKGSGFKYINGWLLSVCPSVS